MKLHRVSSRGFAHHFLLALIVVGTAIGGTYYLVRSFADTCATSSPVSGIGNGTSSAGSNPVSGVNCVSDPTSTPVTNPTVPQLSCSFEGLPTSATLDQLKTASVVLNIANTSANDYSGGDYAVFASNGKDVNTTTANGHYSTIKAHTTSTQKLSLTLSYIPSSYSGTLTFSTLVNNTYCPSPKNITIVAPQSGAVSCRITGVPASTKTGSTFTPVLTITNGTSKVVSSSWRLAVMMGSNTQNVLDNSAYPVGTTPLTLKPGQSTSFVGRPYTTVLYSGSGTVKAATVSQGSTKLMCQVAFKIVAPSIKSVTVHGSDWQYLSKATLVSDTSKTGVLKTNSKVAAFASTTKWLKVKQTWGTTLPKLDAFLGANRGKNIQVCATARVSSGKGYMTLNIFESKQKSATLYFTNKYSRQCFGYKLSMTTDTRLDVNTSGINASGASIDGYLDSVVLSI